MILDHHRRIESHTLDAGQLSNINIKGHVIKNMNLTSSHLANDNLLEKMLTVNTSGQTIDRRCLKQVQEKYTKKCRLTDSFTL